mmetsp:Transcript_157400/g.290046  ORF Transcript_157400/g.290046 Transcript_157400/m.290046 type:complete len:201 (-) Transcript_157400:410-1012(-)
MRCHMQRRVAPAHGRILGSASITQDLHNRILSQLGCNMQRCSLESRFRFRISFGITQHLDQTHIALFNCNEERCATTSHSYVQLEISSSQNHLCCLFVTSRHSQMQRRLMIPSCFVCICCQLTEELQHVIVTHVHSHVHGGGAIVPGGISACSSISQGFDNLQVSCGGGRMNWQDPMDHLRLLVHPRLAVQLHHLHMASA